MQQKYFKGKYPDFKQKKIGGDLTKFSETEFSDFWSEYFGEY
jgi:hypothetical protein